MKSWELEAKARLLVPYNLQYNVYIILSVFERHFACETVVYVNVWTNITSCTWHIYTYEGRFCIFVTCVYVFVYTQFWKKLCCIYLVIFCIVQDNFLYFLKQHWKFNISQHPATVDISRLPHIGCPNTWFPESSYAYALRLEQQVNCWIWFNLTEFNYC